MWVCASLNFCRKKNIKNERKQTIFKKQEDHSISSLYFVFQGIQQC